MKTLLKTLLISSVTLLSSLDLRAEFAIDNPSDRLINLPVKLDRNSNLELTWPGRKKERPPRIIAECQLRDYYVRVLKDGKQRRSTIREVVDGQERVRSFPYVYTRKFNKEMLGQYAVALDVAQELGITELDSIRIYVADPRVNLRKSKVLVFFYDSDDEVIERTLIGEKQWVRCADPGQS